MLSSLKLKVSKINVGKKTAIYSILYIITMMMITILPGKEKCKIFPAWLYGAKSCFSINCQAHNVVSTVMESLYGNTWMSVKSFKNHIVSAKRKQIYFQDEQYVRLFFVNSNWSKLQNNTHNLYYQCIVNAGECVLCCCTDIKQTVSRVWQWFRGLLARMIKRPRGSKTTRKQKNTHTHTGR